MTRASRSICRLAWLVLPALTLVAASAGAAPSRGPSNELGGTPSQCSALQPGNQAVNVHWSAIRTRRPGCFFFSGPGELGRDDPLGTSASLEWGARRVALRFGAVTFEGRRAGSTVTLARQSTHAFAGDWRVTERIHGDLAQVGPECRGLRLTYAYEECHVGDPCPGSCHIDAVLTVAAR
ncbi:MAG: hypothetical protein AB8I08_35085 [Sandaracinaceae bacterium]